MKEKNQSKELARPLRSGSKVHQNMKVPGPPPPKAPKISNKVDDLSILKKSVDTSVTGPLEIMKIFQGGTTEVIDLLKNECCIIYECKVCRNLFRSLANFITHKRNFCTAKFSFSQQSGTGNDALEHSLLVGGVKGTVTSSRKTTRRDILSLLDNLHERLPEAKSSGLIFSEIPQTPTAVYNTTHSPTETNYKPVERGESSVVVGPSGHIVGSTPDSGSTMNCKSCGESVSQIESHVDICTSVFKQCFGCPLCEKYFTTSWAVYRHLKKLHGKSTDQVRKLRNLITKQELPVEQKLKRQSICLPSSNTTNNTDKVRVCYKKDGMTNKLANCRVVATRLSNKDTIAVLSPSNPEKEDEEAEDSVRELAGVATSPRQSSLEPDQSDDRSSQEIPEIPALEVVENDFTILKEHSNQTVEEESTNKTVCEPERDSEVCPLFNSTSDQNRSESDSTGEESNDAKLREFTPVKEVCDNPSQDMFISQSSVIADNDASYTGDGQTIVADNKVTNGFLSSSSSSSKCPDSPPQVTSIEDKLQNGWESPNNDVDKNVFYSSLMNLDVDDNRDSDTQITDHNLDNYDIDSSAITRIICGSVQPLGTTLLDDSSQENTEKRTRSISTEVSMDFDYSEQEPEAEEDDQYNYFYPLLDPYISKTDSICLLCYENITDLRYGYRHIAYHLGLTRYACCVPNCTAQAFAKSDLIDHIKSNHGLDCSASLIRTLDTDEMFTDQVPDFPGFDVSSDILDSVHSEFFNSVMNRHSVVLPSDD